MAGPSDRTFLCSVCGGIFDPPVIGPDGRGEGTCPDCGHGYSTVATASAVFTGSESRRIEDHRRVEDHRLRRERVLRERPFAVFGLDSRWTGLRWIGGWGTRGEIEHLTLAHGDPFDESGPLVRVSTWRRSPSTVANAAEELAHYMWMDAGAPHDLVRPTFTSGDPIASWSNLTLPVDAHPTPFRSLTHGPHWVAISETLDRLITIEVRHLPAPSLGLTTVHDITPYLAEPPAHR